MYGLLGTLRRAIGLERTGDLCPRAGANDQVVVADARGLAVDVDDEGLATNVEVGCRAEDELKLFGPVLGKALGDGLEQLLVVDLARDNAARGGNVPEEVAVARHQGDLVRGGGALVYVLEEPVGRADTGKAAAYDDDVLHFLRGQVWEWWLAEVICREDVEGRAEDV